MDSTKRCIQQLIAPPTGLHDQLMTLVLYRQWLIPGNKPFTPGDLRKMFEEVDLEPPSEDTIREYLRTAQHCHRTAKDDYYTVKDEIPNIWQEGLADCLDCEKDESTTLPRSIGTEQETQRQISLKTWARDHWLASWMMFLIAISPGVVWFFDRDLLQSDDISEAPRATTSGPGVLHKHCIQQLIAPPTGLHDQLMILALYWQSLVPESRSLSPGDFRKMYEDVDLESPSEDRIRAYLDTAQHFHRTAKKDHYALKSELPVIWQDGIADCLKRDDDHSTTSS